MRMPARIETLSSESIDWSQYDTWLTEADGHRIHEIVLGERPQEACTYNEVIEFHRVIEQIILRKAQGNRSGKLLN